MILTLIIATHACMLTCICSSAPYRYAFNAKYNALLPLAHNLTLLIIKELSCVQIYDFGTYFSPVIFSAQNH